MDEFKVVLHPSGYETIPDCPHRKVETRKRFKKNGVQICSQQCLNCGRQVKQIPISTVNLLALPLWDEQLENDYYRRRNQAFSDYHAEKKRRENAEWWEKYEFHLASPKWQELRRKVFERSRGFCEGCGERRAVQVHHLTYERLGDEMLFDLAAVCLICHRKIHDEK